ncbi:MAG TPA: DUF1345 domain-containing protein [Acidimicrobiales bacterium]|nr:DUF1345 domain-containing protein [Acidimicrobiales bacterium]
MTTVPAATPYHRWLGWHAPAAQRVLIATAVGVAAAAVASLFVSWERVPLLGWDAFALTNLLVVWPLLLRATAAAVEEHATKDDATRFTALLLVLSASLASLVAVAFVLGEAGRESGNLRLTLIGLATITVMLSWTLVNTVFVMRYAHLYYAAPGHAVDFGTTGDEPPDYRDFAYLAFTIGMTYQVSDTTLHDRRIRRTVLAHAGISYIFGVVIIAAGINLVAGLVK